MLFCNYIPIHIVTNEQDTEFRLKVKVKIKAKVYIIRLKVQRVRGEE
jgi:hypothetical protein